MKHAHELAHLEIESLQDANTKMEAELLNTKSEVEGLQLKLVWYTDCIWKHFDTAKHEAHIEIKSLRDSKVVRRPTIVWVFKKAKLIE